jgi:hypothetical protein
MNLSRRTVLKGLAASAAALLLPPSLIDNAEAAKRFWALDSTMLGPEPDWGMFGPYNSAASFGQWVDTIHLSDPAIGMPAAQAGGRPPSPWNLVVRGPEHMGMAAYQAAIYRDRPDLPFVRFLDYPPMPQREQYESPLVFLADAHRAGVNPREEALRLLAREMAYADEL